MAVPGMAVPDVTVPDVTVPGTTAPAVTTASSAIEPLPAAGPHNIPSEFQALRWSYDSRSGPSQWGQLDANFALCDRGQQQSPIALEKATASDLPNLIFHYGPSPVSLLNNGRTLQVAYAPGSSIELEGNRFDLVQFHFHHPSEHRIEDQDYPMELHLVHRDRSGNLAVLGIMIEAGAENSALLGVWRNLLPAYTSLTQTSASVDANQLLPPVATAYRYRGSLTTPPCSESVQWIVMDHPIQLSAQQIAAFEALVPANNRPYQVVNNRAIQLDSSP